MTLKFDQQAWRRAGRQLGLPGGVGVLLLVLAAWGQWVNLPALQREVAHTAQEAQRVRQGVRAGGGVAAVQLTPEQAVAALLARLPTPAQRSGVLAGILQAAREQNLSIDTLQLHQSDEGTDGAGTGGGGAGRGASVSRQQIDLPLKGSYAQIRAWLVRLLQEQPALSLDALELKRADAQTDQLDARVSLSLWVFDGPTQTQAQP